MNSNNAYTSAINKIYNDETIQGSLRKGPQVNLKLFLSVISNIELPVYSQTPKDDNLHH